MTDVSDDDLADNYGPTTPAPAKIARARASGKPVAGPSKPSSKTTASKKPAGKAAATIELNDDDDEEVEFVEPAAKRRKASEEVVVVPAKAAAKKASGRAGSVMNGVSKIATAKGKARADPSGKAAPVNGTLDEAMEVDDEGGAELDEEESPDPPIQRSVQGGGRQPKMRNGTVATARQTKVEEKLARENDSLRAQLEQAREYAKEIAAQRDKLSNQLEEFFHVRRTEAEQALADYKAHFEESMKRKESLIQELTGQLSKLQSPSKSNQSYTLHFLTREAAEEEKRALQDENNRLKEVIKQRDATIAVERQRITALESDAAVVKKELDAEIERSKSLVSRPPASTLGRSTHPAPSSPKNAPVIKLYEDMTNVLVTSVRYEKSPEWPDLDEEIVTCIFLYNNVNEATTFSLTFTLRNVYDKPVNHPPNEPISRDKLTLKVKYHPQALENEPASIIQRLQFFKDPFMFSRDQMTVFLKTLTETVAGAFEGDDSVDGPSGEDPDVPIVLE